MKNWFKALISFFTKAKKESYYYRLENLEEEPVKVSYDEVPSEIPVEEPTLPEIDFVEPPPAPKKAKKKSVKKGKKKKNQWEV